MTGRLSIPVVLAAMIFAAGLGATGIYTIAGRAGNATADSAAAAVTGSIKTDTRSLGPSGLPLPRFVSLKRARVNVRRGPSSEHKIAWIFTRKALPVEIIAEFEHWRRIRDSDGQEGWVYQSLLAGHRTVTIAPWRKNNPTKMYTKPDTASNIVAKVDSGVVGEVKKCTGKWCLVNIDGYNGWVSQAMLWGVYPNEIYSR